MIKKIFIIIFLLISSNIAIAKSIKPTAKINIIEKDFNKIVVKFAVALAISDYDKENGLMYIENMPSNYGMLFIFNNDNNPIQMWMHNTLINLDMIFIDKNNKIIGLHRNAKTLDKTLIYAPKKTMKVLEINAGMINKFKIKEGQFIVDASS